MQLSSATKRAQNYSGETSEWCCSFVYTDVKGIGYEEGVHRRDPSSVLKANGLYYVWYTKSCGPHFGKKIADPYAKQFPWDYADIYYATSKDGVNWQEQGPAVKRGGKGEYDERTVCTPDVMEYDGKYYLVYQAMPQGNYTGYDEYVAMAVAQSPDGPWVKKEKNILEPMKPGRWFEGIAKDNYNDDYFTGRTHDPMLMHYNNKFYLYYKCGANHDKLKFCGFDTRWGVAVSDNVLGPYEHSEFNPVTNSGHETLLWHYNGGIAALLNRDGPEKNTIQFAKDGVNFELMARLEGNTPMAGGAFRCDDHDDAPLAGLRWGLCHYDERGSLWNHIVRFDVDTRKHPYDYPLEHGDNNCQWLGT